jgi:hypothetical protein
MTSQVQHRQFDFDHTPRRATKAIPYPIRAQKASRQMATSSGNDADAEVDHEKCEAQSSSEPDVAPAPAVATASAECAIIGLMSTEEQLLATVLNEARNLAGKRVRVAISNDVQPREGILVVTDELVAQCKIGLKDNAHSPVRPLNAMFVRAIVPVE